MNATANAAAVPDIAQVGERIQTEVQRAIQRSIKGVEYFASSGPALGSTPKDIILSKGTMNLYHYRPLADEIYRIPILIVMATTNRGYILDMVPGQSFKEGRVRGLNGVPVSNATVIVDGTGYRQTAVTGSDGIIAVPAWWSSSAWPTRSDGDAPRSRCTSRPGQRSAARVSGRPNDTSRPRCMTAIRSALVPASERKWVHRTIVRPRSRALVSIRSITARAPVGSRPEVGSSRKRSSGSWTSARAQAIRRR